MNKIIYILSILIIGVCGCSEEKSAFQNSIKSDIPFSAEHKSSRVYYKGEEGEDAWQLCWDKDTVQVACNQAYNGFSSYIVTPTSETTGALSPLTSPQLTWGKADTHYFYSGYPYNKVTIVPQDSCAIFKFAFNETQPAYLDTSKGFIASSDTTYYTKADMTQAYMVASTKARRVVDNKVTLQYKPIMTTLDIYVQREKSDTVKDGFASYGCFITGLQVQLPLKGEIKDTFYYKESLSGNSGACDFQGKFLNSTTTKSIFLPIKTSFGNNYINLQPGQKIKFTVLIPPVDIAAGTKIKVLGSGFKTTTITLSSQAFKASEKKQITLQGLTADQSLPTRNLANWMSSINDSALVCNLSIPGAKHANATNQQEGSVMTDNSTTHVQHLSYEEMVQAGCRAFEFRVNYARYNGGGLKTDAYCYIGKESSKSFHDNYKELITALNNHPTEFFILYLNLQNSSGMTPDGADSNKFKKWFVGYLLNKDTLDFTHNITDLPTYQGSARIPKDWIVLWKPDLTVGECRGKIIVITNFDIINPEKFGIVRASENGWSEDTPFSKTGTYTMNGTASKLMFFDLDKWKNREEKIIKNYLYNYYQNYQIEALTTKYWMETRLGSPNGNWEKRSSYLDNAQKIYPYYTTLITATAFPRPLGSVMIHFFGETAADNSGNPEALTKAIINNNYKYKLK